MKLDQLDGYIAFIAVARSRSFTAAAAQLGVSPQAVSQAIKGLEARLGLRLLHRTTRSVSLNEVGSHLFARVAPALESIFEATESLHALHDHPAGLLRINLSHVAFTALIRPRIAQFQVRFPDIRLEFGFNDGFIDIVEQGFDLGIRLGEAVAQDMVSIPMSREERIALVATPAYLSAHGQPATIAELREHRCIRFRQASSGALYRWELLAEGQAIVIDTAESLIVNDTDAMLALALAGQGLAYLLERTARPHLASGALCEVLGAHTPRFPGFHLYYPAARQTPAKLACFTEFWRAR